MGSYTIIRKHKNNLFIKYMEAKKPCQVFAVRFKKTTEVSFEDLLSSENLKVSLIEQSKFDSQELSQDIWSQIQGVTQSIISLENGADA